MIKEHKIIDNLIEKTNDNQIFWLGVGKNTDADFYSKIRIMQTKKYIRLDIKSEFRKGRYYRVLKIVYCNGITHNILKTLYATKYTQIYNLERLVRERAR